MMNRRMEGIDMSLVGKGSRAAALAGKGFHCCADIHAVTAKCFPPTILIMAPTIALLCRCWRLAKSNHALCVSDDRNNPQGTV